MAFEVVAPDSLRFVSGRTAGNILMETTSVHLVSSIETDWPDAFQGTAQRIQHALDTPALQPLIPVEGISFAPTAPNLICVSREFTFGSPLTFEILAQYRYLNLFLNPEVQVGAWPRIVRPSGGLRQVTLNQDSLKQLIKVQHESKIQIAEVSVLDAEMGFSQEVVLASAKPIEVVDKWQNTINKSPWFFNAAVGPDTISDENKWLCTNVIWEPLHIINPLAADSRFPRPLFIFTFSFQLNRQGWPPIALWRDPGTGRSPDGLTQGEKGSETSGYHPVEWYVEIDFKTEPQSYIDG